MGIITNNVNNILKVGFETNVNVNPFNVDINIANELVKEKLQELAEVLAKTGSTKLNETDEILTETIKTVQAELNDLLNSSITNTDFINNEIEQDSAITGSALDDAAKKAINKYSAVAFKEINLHANKLNKTFADILSLHKFSILTSSKNSFLMQNHIMDICDNALQEQTELLHTANTDLSMVENTIKMSNVQVDMHNAEQKNDELARLKFLAAHGNVLERIAAEIKLKNIERVENFKKISGELKETSSKILHPFRTVGDTLSKIGSEVTDTFANIKKFWLGDKAKALAEQQRQFQEEQNRSLQVDKLLSEVSIIQDINNIISAFESTIMPVLTSLTTINVTNVIQNKFNDVNNILNIGFDQTNKFINLFNKQSILDKKLSKAFNTQIDKIVTLDRFVNKSSKNLKRQNSIAAHMLAAIGAKESKTSAALKDAAMTAAFIGIAFGLVGQVLLSVKLVRKLMDKFEKIDNTPSIPADTFSSELINTNIDTPALNQYEPTFKNDDSVADIVRKGFEEQNVKQKQVTDDENAKLIANINKVDDELLTKSDIDKLVNTNVIDPLNNKRTTVENQLNDKTAQTAVDDAKLKEKLKEDATNALQKISADDINERLLTLINKNLATMQNLLTENDSAGYNLAKTTKQVEAINIKDEDEKLRLELENSLKDSSNKNPLTLSKSDVKSKLDKYYINLKSQLDKAWSKNIADGDKLLTLCKYLVERESKSTELLDDTKYKTVSEKRTALNRNYSSLKTATSFD